jgi:hypothetical protein
MAGYTVPNLYRKLCGDHNGKPVHLDALKEFDPMFSDAEIGAARDALQCIGLM